MRSNKNPDCHIFLCYRDAGAEIAKHFKKCLEDRNDADFGHIWYSDLENIGHYIKNIPSLITSAEYAIIFFSEGFTAGFLNDKGKINYSKGKHDSGCVTVREIIQIEKCRQAGTLTVVGVNINGYHLSEKDKDVLDKVFHEAGIYTDSSVEAYTELNSNDYYTRKTDMTEFCYNLSRGMSLSESKKSKITKVNTDLLTPPLTYECLGRDGEIAQLTRMLREKSCINLYAPHGSGKSSLVFHWLSSIATESYYGAEYVFCWQFLGGSKRYSIPENLNDFFEKLIDFLGINDISDESSEMEKATAIAEFIKLHPTILILDNLDVLMAYDSDGNEYITNVAMHRLITQISRDSGNDNGLLVLLSSNRISELQYYPQNTELIPLKPLSAVDCVSMLRHIGVLGSDKELNQAVAELSLNPLAISLMGKIIVNKYNKRISERYRINYSSDDTRRLSMESVFSIYDELWPISSKDGRVLLLCSLFRSSIDQDCLDYLIKSDVSSQLFSGLTTDSISSAFDIFKRVGLIYGERESSLIPTVREYYRTKFAQNLPEDYRLINLAIAKYLSSCDDEYIKTLDDLSTFYDAIYHYILADEPNPAIDILWNRIFRKRSFFSQKQLGAISNDLCAVSLFFDIDRDWTPNPKLSNIDAAWLTSVAAYLLNSIGGLNESEKLRNRELEIYKSIGARLIYASDAHNLARNLMLQGRLDESEMQFISALEALDSGKADVKSPYAKEIDEKSLRANIISKYAFLLCLKDGANRQKALEMIRSLDTEVLKDHTTSMFYYCYLSIDSRCNDSITKDELKKIKTLISTFNKNKRLEAAYANLLSAMIDYMQITPLNLASKYRLILSSAQQANEIANITGRNDQLPFILNELLEMYTNLYIKVGKNTKRRSEILERIEGIIINFEEIDSMYRIPLYRVEHYALLIRYYVVCRQDKAKALEVYDNMRMHTGRVGYFKRRMLESEKLLSEMKYL